jgi:hypothetical protein
VLKTAILTMQVGYMQVIDAGCALHRYSAVLLVIAATVAELDAYKRLSSMNSVVLITFILNKQHNA